MDLKLDNLLNKITKNEFIDNFMKELSKELENSMTQSKNEDMEEIKLTTTEELEFTKKEFKFLQEYFAKELENKAKDPIYIVTDKYEGDDELHRYKVAQYKNNLEYKYIAFEKDLPSNVKIGDVVRKTEEKYIYDSQATRICKKFFKQNKKRNYRR